MEVRESAMAYGRQKFTVEEYLKMERTAEQKHEYFRGEIFAMAGAGARHNVIFKNLYGELAYHLKGKSCQPYGSDLRIHIPENSLFTYPDISVICSDIVSPGEDNDTVIHPAVLIEILSRSTKDCDRGTKLKLYRDIASLKEYVLIDSEAVSIEVFCITGHGHWQLTEYKNDKDILQIRTIDFQLPLHEIYRGTKLV